jgi:hypothetical protein
MNPNYATIVKQDTKKFLIANFVAMVEEATCLSPIVVVPKKKGKAMNLCGFPKIKCNTKKDSYPLPFIKEVLDMVVRHEVYSFLDGFSSYH